MNKILLAAASLAATLTVASPAMATPSPAPTPANDPCTATWVVGAIACQGYYDKNWLTGGKNSATTTDELAAINLLLTGTASTSDSLPTDNTNAYNPPYNLDYDTVLSAISGLNGSATMTFDITLTGLVVVGAHFGNNPDSTDPNVTAFWLVDLGGLTTNTLTLTNGQGSSNAQIFANGGTDTRLPEPSTWAMMLMGFGAAGVAVRRSRRKSGKTLVSQLA